VARRFYANREPGLRLDVVASLGPDAPAPAAARLGGTLHVPAGTRSLELTVDVDGGPASLGRDVELQVLTTGLIVRPCSRSSAQTPVAPRRCGSTCRGTGTPRRCPVGASSATQGDTGAE